MTFCEDTVLKHVCFILALCLRVLKPLEFLSLADFLNTLPYKLRHRNALKHNKTSHIFKWIGKTIKCSILTPFQVCL